MNWGYIFNPWREVRRLRRDLRLSQSNTALLQSFVDNKQEHLIQVLNARRDQCDILETVIRKAAEATGFEGDFGFNYRNLAAYLDLVSAKPSEKESGYPIQQRQ